MTHQHKRRTKHKQSPLNIKFEKRKFAKSRVLILAAAVAVSGKFEDLYKFRF